MKTRRNPIQSAFTLIELLVVITIIAILAGIGTPAMMKALMQGKITAATGNARQIGLALRMYAQDNSGAYPDGPGLTSSNDAFRELFPDYVQSEAIFVVGNSKVGRRADNKIEPVSRALERGENHWAYVAGLTDTSNSMWPLIVDHTDGSGNYSNVENNLGGTWRGTKGIVIRCDQSAAAIRLGGTGSKRFLPRHDDDDENALQVREYMGEEVRLLEPVR